MENRTFYNEILTDHNLHPLHKEKLPDANLVLEGVNPSCGDDIILQLKVEDGQVVDGAFEGSGCAISPGVRRYHAGSDHRKIRRGSTPSGGSVPADDQGRGRRERDRRTRGSRRPGRCSHMPARVKCAVLGWHTMEEMLDKKNEK